MTMKSLFGATSLAFVLSATAGLADNKETASVFYDLLSNPGDAAMVEAFQNASTSEWISIGNYTGENKSRDAFIGQMGGFAQLMPDLDWAIQDMHEDGDTVVVRSRATGTPVAPFFGVDGQGRSFDILTIDIHEFEEGKIVRTYHVEDWATALQQLSGK
ncbi:ester cyclase [Pelagimonas varians]|uniref:SnoaL-like polyketide cyclase n=2 Tax=Pelagimonas varians TaxID=696760 RepID=A0A238JTF3_9RHOB|nr:putative ester cyclase [Pelagimonas varians]SMX33763.1 SnoaL-like polyketide cyclase [Pelagimonas varians]